MGGEGAIALCHHSDLAAVCHLRPNLTEVVEFSRCSDKVIQSVMLQSGDDTTFSVGVYPWEMA